MKKTRVLSVIAGLTLLAVVATGCGTLTGAAVGAAGGAIYDATHY